MLGRGRWVLWERRFYDEGTKTGGKAPRPARPPPACEPASPFLASKGQCSPSGLYTHYIFICISFYFFNHRRRPDVQCMLSDSEPEPSARSSTALYKSSTALPRASAKQLPTTAMLSDSRPSASKASDVSCLVEAIASNSRPGNLEIVGFCSSQYVVMHAGRCFSSGTTDAGRCFSSGSA